MTQSLTATLSSEHREISDFSDLPLVSVVMPCLNEEEAIAHCIHTIQDTFERYRIPGEIVVSDNGSTDNSVAIAESMGVRVVHQPLRGYGNAYIKGFEYAQGHYLIMGDADDTYDFRLIPEFLKLLHYQGYDFVTGSRYLGDGGKHITLLHRLVGNPALTALLNILFGSRYTDVYCGFRGFSRNAYEKISPVSPGMEFNLELAINAGLAGLKIAELPIVLAPRKGESKLRTLRDGWRSLRMMLLYSPNKVFLWPGITLFSTGIGIHLILLLQLLRYDGRPLGAVTGIFALVLSVIGFQILNLGLHTKTYSWTRRFDKDNQVLRLFYKWFNLEKGLLLGIGLMVWGSVIMIRSMLLWFEANLVALPNPEWVSFGATLVIIGCGTVFSSLFVSAMSMKRVGSYEQLQ